MKKILAFKGSPRNNGNSTIMLNNFIDGAKSNNSEIEIIDPYKTNVNFCLGCLKCNVTKKCIQQNDDWEELSQKILDADVLVFASPVYFHHFPAPMKIILDRFRSFVNITITETGLIHTPWHYWDKKFVLLLSMGTIEDVDAQPLIDLFEFLREFLGLQNSLDVIKAKRVAMAKQIAYDEEKLKFLYTKLKLSDELAQKDFKMNQIILQKCFELGKRIG